MGSNTFSFLKRVEVSAFFLLALFACKVQTNQEALEQSALGPPNLSYNGAAGTLGQMGKPMRVIPSLLDGHFQKITSCALTPTSPPLPGGVTIDPASCEIVGTPTEILKKTGYQIIASSSQGNSLAASVTLQITPGVPTLQYGDIIELGVGETLTGREIYPAFLAENGTPVLGCKFKPGTSPPPAGIRINSDCSITGTANLPSELSYYTVIATNLVGDSSDARVGIQINPSTPVLTYLPSGNSTPQKTGTLLLNGSTTYVAQVSKPFSILPIISQDSGKVTCGDLGALQEAGDPSVEDLKSTIYSKFPNGVTVNSSTCKISGTPGSYLNPTKFAVIVKNSTGNDVVNFTLQIAAGKPTLVYDGVVAPQGIEYKSGTKTYAGFVGDSISILPAVNSGGLPVTSCRVTTPGFDLTSYGLSIMTSGSSACEINGSPTISGSLDISVVATNIFGDSVPAQLKLLINPTAPHLTFPTTEISLIKGSTINLPIWPTVANPNGQRITQCGVTASAPTPTASPLPVSTPAPGLYVDHSTCAILGTPSQVTPSTTYYITPSNFNPITQTGGLGPSAPVKIKVVDKPVLSYALSYGTSGSVGVPFLVSPSTLNTNGSLLSCSLTAGSPTLPAGLKLSQTDCSISGIPTASKAAAQYYVLASNEAGDSIPAAVSFGIAGVAPQIKYPAIKNVIQLTARPASDPSPTPTYSVGPLKIIPTVNGKGNKVVCSWVSGSIPPGVTFDTYNLLENDDANIANCSIIALVGSHDTPMVPTPHATYTIRATNFDNNLSVDVPVGFAVIDVPVLHYPYPVPEMTSGYPQSLSPSIFINNYSDLTECSVNPEPSGVPTGPPSGVRIPSILPQGLTLNSSTCLISGTPSGVVTPGVTYYIQGKNAAGVSQNAPVKLTINAAAPELSYAGGPSAGAVYQASGDYYLATPNFSIQIGPSNLNPHGTAVTSCTPANGLPPGIFIDQHLCTIYGTPTNSFQLSVTAKNAQGISSTPASVQVIVTNDITQPILAYGGGVTSGVTNVGETYIGTSGVALSIAPVILLPNKSGAGGSIINCALSTVGSLPAGLSLNSTTCVISGTPTTPTAKATFGIVATNNQLKQNSPALITLQIDGGAPQLNFPTGSIFVNTQATSIKIPAKLQTNGAAVSGCAWVGGSSPPGLSVNNSNCDITKTGIITPNVSVTPVPTPVPTYTVQVTYTQSDGASGTQNVALPIGIRTAWEPVSTVSAPTARIGQTAVWTGSKMIIWGGIAPGGSVGQSLASGGIYDPISDTWDTATITNSGILPERKLHSSVWTGSRMIVWGGQTYSGHSNDGAIFDPTTNSWSLLSMTGVPSGRISNSAIWSGSEMVIYGGTGSVPNINDGARFNPGTNTWSPLDLTGCPSLPTRDSHTAIWAGNKMIVWGGQNSPANGPPTYNSGFIWDPSNASTPCSAISTSNSPTARIGHSAVWTGNDMLIFGGFNLSLSPPQTYADGGRLHLTSGAWSTIGTGIGSDARSHALAVWADTKMVVWGGLDSSSLPLNSGWIYDPVLDSWTSIPLNSSAVPSAASSSQSDRVAVWADSAGTMIIWGGPNPGDSGRFNLCSPSVECNY